MQLLQFRMWFGSASERHTSDDWNRLVDNAIDIAAEIGATITPPFNTSDAGALTLYMAQSMEQCISDLSAAANVPYAPFTWLDGDFVSFVDINRWEFGLWACYKAAGGEGRPEDSITMETLMLPYSGWVQAPDGTFSQTVPSVISVAGMTAAIGLSQHQADQVSSWSVLGPYVTAAGNQNVTVKCSGMMIGGKDLEVTLFKVI